MILRPTIRPTADQAKPVRVYLYYNYQSKPAYIKTEVFVMPLDWNADKFMVAKSDKLADNKNTVLLQEKNRIEKWLLEYHAQNGCYPPANGINVTMKGKSNERLTLDRIEQLFLAWATQRECKPISAGTEISYRATFNAIREFDNVFNTEQINSVWVGRFLSGMDSLGSKKLRLQHIKTILSWMVDNGYSRLDLKTIESFSIAEKYQRDIIYFEPDEEAKLWSTNFETDETYSYLSPETRRLYQQVLDWHNLMLGSGLRQSDIDLSRWLIDWQDNMVRVKPEKTKHSSGAVATFRMDENMQRLVRKYVSGRQTIPVEYLSILNEHIKAIGREIGLTRSITLLHGRNKFKSGDTVELWQLMSTRVGRSSYGTKQRERLGVDAASYSMGITPNTLMKHYGYVGDNLLKRAEEKAVLRVA